MKKWIMLTAVALVVCLSTGTLFASHCASHGKEGCGATCAKAKSAKAGAAKAGAAKEATPARAREPRAWGSVKSIDVKGGKIVVAVRRRRQREATETTFKITDETKVLFGTEEKTLADLAEGKNVTITYKAAEEEGGEAVALTITIRLPRAFGTLKSVDADAGKIVVAVRTRRGEEPTDKTFLVDKDTTVRIGREEKTLADLAEGARVVISYKTPEKKDGDPTVVSIMVRGARRRRARTNTDVAR